MHTQRYDVTSSGKLTRRRLLGSLAGSSVVSVSGCLSDDRTLPVNVSLLNGRPEQFSSNFLLRLESGTELFRADLEIPAPKDQGDRRIISLENVAQVDDGERVFADMRIDGDTYTTSQEVTCGDGRVHNVFRFVIYRAEDRGGLGMDIQALSRSEDNYDLPC